VISWIEAFQLRRGPFTVDGSEFPAITTWDLLDVKKNGVNNGISTTNLPQLVH